MCRTLEFSVSTFLCSTVHLTTQRGSHPMFPSGFSPCSRCLRLYLDTHPGHLILLYFECASSMPAKCLPGVASLYHVGKRKYIYYPLPHLIAPAIQRLICFCARVDDDFTSHPHETASLGHTEESSSVAPISPVRFVHPAVTNAEVSFSTPQHARGPATSSMTHHRRSACLYRPLECLKH